jgi:hypothetical protein
MFIQRLLQVLSPSYLIHTTTLDQIHWIANNLAPALENIPPTISVAVQLYITGSTAVARELDESLKESYSEVALNTDPRLYSTVVRSPFVQVYQGRPDTKQLISKEIGEATGRVSINGLYSSFKLLISIEPHNLFFCLFSLRVPFTGQ